MLFASYLVLPRISTAMSKGWESKNVEEQMAEREQTTRPQPKTNGGHSGIAATARQKQALEMQKELVLNQRTSNPHRRASLAAALEHIENQLAALDVESGLKH